MIQFVQIILFIFLVKIINNLDFFVRKVIFNRGRDSSIFKSVFFRERKYNNILEMNALKIYMQ